VLALLVLAGMASASAQPVADGFEAGALGPLWATRAVPARVTVQRDTVRSGAFGLRIEVNQGDMAQKGGDGEATERSEIQEADGLEARFGETHEYRFSMYVPADFPIGDTRLVTSQWKQDCDVCARNRSPIIAQRYRKGVLHVTIETLNGRTTIYRHPEPIQGRWLDLRYRIRFGWTDGGVSVWVDGARVADYQGPLGYPDDPPAVRFRMGLYRNRMAQPMVIYFDDYRKERIPD
jgi:polysaccharide lyase-like protein